MTYFRQNSSELAKKEKITIGKEDLIDFPQLNLWGIRAKIDTGADSSSIHVRRIKVEKRADKEVLTCSFGIGKPATFEQFSQTQVRSSNGQVEIRYRVNLEVLIFGNRFITAFTLSNRKSMTFPVLLGKKFLRKRFIVDVSLSNLSQKQQNQTKL